MVGFWYTIKPRAKGVANNFWFRLALTELEKWPKLPRGACELQPKLLAGSGTGILSLTWAGNEVEEAACKASILFKFFGAIEPIQVSLIFLIADPRIVEMPTQKPATNCANSFKLLPIPLFPFPFHPFSPPSLITLQTGRQLG